MAELKFKGSPLDIRDLLIGTIALTEEFALKTYNKKHFERIKNLTFKT